TLVVLSYSIVTGTNNDSARLWVNPPVSSFPAADAKSAITIGGDATDIARIFLRQGNAGTPNCIVDGIHVGLSWPDIMGTATGPVTPANALTFVPTGLNQLSFSWNRPGDYDPATMQTIAFLKKTSPLTIDTPTTNPIQYIANTDFSANGTLYQHDSLAKCVYNGDSNTVSISGLTLATGYYLHVFLVRAADSAYSTPIGTFGTTQANKPANVTAALFSLTSFTGTTLSWTKPAGYLDSNMTVLVFLKQATPVAVTGTVNAAPSTYIANTDFSANGTTFLNDTLAKCIYNGDGTTVPITGLQLGTTYYANFYVVRSTDSNYYSNLIITGVVTTSQPGAVTALNLNATGQTTATINWTKPINYSNTSMTTLVFVKEATAVTTVSTPIKTAYGYNANADFSSTGNSFLYDSLAKCVLNSDSSFVNITGLSINTTYHVLVYVVRTTDSVYSIASNAYGITYGTVLPPKPLKTLSVKANTALTAGATWTKDSTFSDSTDLVLVFLKKGSAVVQGIPTLNPTNYSTDTVFGNGTAFQNDTAAKCVYKGIGSTVSLSGLLPSTSYFMMAYIVRAADSSYASAIASTVITPTHPVTAVSVVGQSGTSIKITWIKPATYVNASYSTLVFVKAENAITVGTPTRIVSSYTANVNFGLGTKYQNDPLAYCIFKGDTNFANISNLVQNKSYEVLILVVRDLDSSYSAGATGTGITLPPPAPVTIGSINATNPTTGNPDSLGVRVTLRGLTYGINMLTTGLRFVLRDATGGITVLSATKNFSYSINEGDSIEVQGSITTTRGLLCVTIDTLFYRASGKTIKSPTVVSKVSETTENDLVRVNNLRFITTPGVSWFATTYPCIVDGTSDTVILRITPNNSLVGTAIPATSTFNAVGLGTQVSTSAVAPFLFNGYQLLPRSTNDIVLPDTLAPFSLVMPQANDTLTLIDTSSVIVFNWRTAKVFGKEFPSYTFMLDTFGSSFTTPVIEISSNNTGIDSVYSLSALHLADRLHLQPFVTYKANWKVRATLGSFTEYSEVNPIYITRSAFTSIPSVNVLQSFELYPNPASGTIFIRHSESLQTVSILNQLGQVVLHQTVNAQQVNVSTTLLDRGIYFVHIKTATETITQKLFLK
ncbi:MAG: T9SS type A sorting domain-containing protein, partial [Bacteroidota bacterium]